MSFSQPFTRSGSAGAVIACTTTRTTYTATVTGVHVGDLIFDLGVTTAGYRGPGTYPSTVALAISSPLLVALPAGTSIPVLISSAGGSVQISGTTSNSRKIVGSVSWTCPTG